MATESLTCENGKGHKWTRERTRGRKPRFCPKHKPSTEDSGTRQPIMKSFSSVGAAQFPVTMVTLPCEIGKHNWQRPSQRGRKPANCPEHSIAPSAPVKQRAAKRVSSTKDDGLATVTNLDDYKEQRELQRVLREQRAKKANDRIDNLDIMLKSRGLHLSQQPDWQPPVAPEVEQALAQVQPVKAAPKKRMRKKAS